MVNAATAPSILIWPVHNWYSVMRLSKFR